MKSSLPFSSLRAGIIGTGFIGPVHVEALRRLGVNVTAICGSTAGARAVAARWNIPEVYGDYDSQGLVASPNVDVVHITSPNRWHAEQALAVIQAGKHCICEKPLAMNSRETAAILRAARRSGSVFAVNYNVRFYPAVLELRHQVARGDLGEIIHVEGSYLQDWLYRETDYNWRLLAEEGGALRAVADIGTHWMDTVGFILQSPVRQVLADLGTFHKVRRRPVGEVKTFAKVLGKVRSRAYPVRTEDYAHILLEYTGGVKGSLSVSQVAAGRKNCIRIEIYGSKQSAWWNSEDPDHLHFGRRDEPNALAFRNSPAFQDGAAGYMDYPAGAVEGFPDSFKMLFRSIYGAIASDGKGDGLFASAADGHAQVRVCEAILQSHRHRSWMKVKA